MRLTRPIVLAILGVLFAAALVTRHATTSRLDTPYFKGTSAMDYRHAMGVAEGVSLSARDTRAAHPDGYVPARVRASGVEYATGHAYRAAGFFGENDGRRFTRRLSVLCASLCVFTMYAFVRRLWDCQAAGLVAAFAVALLGPLVVATNGRTFTHTAFATLVATLHAAVALRALSGRSLAAALVSAGVALVLLSVWEPAPIVVLAWMVPAALAGTAPERSRIAFVAGHATALALGSTLLPHLAATRALAGWTTAAGVSCLAVVLLHRRLQRRWQASAVLVAVTSVLTVLGAAFRTGAPEQFPSASYILTRLRFPFDRPESPSALSDWMRSLWTLDHAPLTPHAAIELFVPLFLLAGATLLCRSSRARRAPFAAAGIVAAVAAAAVAVDRSALPLAAMAMIPFAAGGVRGLRSGPWLRPALAILGGAFMFATTAFRGGALDPSLGAARAAGVAYRDPGAFVWVSLANTDRELIRFIATRTSVNECILAPDDVSALVLAFSGRAVVQLPGATSREPCERRVALAKSLYGSESDLYRLCRERQVAYVLYSIDTVLDGGRYGPLYLSGSRLVDPKSIAFAMHFEPESIRHFTLIYENDHYRLFKVTEQAEPVFLTDHPLFYQRDVLARAGGSLETFRERVVHLLLSCARGVNVGAAGDVEGARQLLSWCVKQAPHFTRARMALADALVDLGRYDEALAQVTEVVRYAPDNSPALYYAAYLEVQLGRAEAARPYLQLIRTQERDPALLEKVRALESYIDQKLPIRPAPPRSG